VNITRQSKTKFDYLTIKHLTLGILQPSTSPVLQSLQTIISSELDCDRLDYVPRDLAMSGINRDAIDYDRLLVSHQLIQDDASGRFEVVPSARALSAIEDFFQRRFNLYKYVVYHHRVVKTDGLLKEAIIYLSREYLSSPLNDTEFSGQMLPRDISGLWAVFDPRNSMLTMERIYHYIHGMILGSFLF